MREKLFTMQKSLGRKMNSKYDHRTEDEMFADGYRIERGYDDMKLYRRNDVMILAHVSQDGLLEVILQLKIPKEIRENNHIPFWRKPWKYLTGRRNDHIGF